MQAATVEGACPGMGPCDPHKRLAQASFPNAQIVADKFHTALADGRADEVPQASRRRAQDKQLRAGCDGETSLSLDCLHFVDFIQFESNGRARGREKPRSAVCDGSAGLSRARVDSNH